jgi:hypothetical protein
MTTLELFRKNDRLKYSLSVRETPGFICQIPPTVAQKFVLRASIGYHRPLFLFQITETEVTDENIGMDG